LRRICQEAAYVEFIGETRVTIPLREISDFGEVEHEKEDVGDIDLPGPAQDAGAQTEEVLLELDCSWDDIGRWKDAGVIS
jgi:hypothetical protein